jgi:hypothetical protein
MNLPHMQMRFQVSSMVEVAESLVYQLVAGSNIGLSITILNNVNGIP